MDIVFLNMAAHAAARHFNSEIEYVSVDGSRYSKKSNLVISGLLVIARVDDPQGRTFDTTRSFTLVMDPLGETILHSQLEKPVVHELFEL